MAPGGRTEPAYPLRAVKDNGQWLMAGHLPLKTQAVDLLFASLPIMLGKGYDGLNKGPTMEERESARLSGEGDKIKLIDLTFEKEQVVGFGKEECRRSINFTFLR